MPTKLATQLERRAGPFTEDASGYVYLSPTLLGWGTGCFRTDHRFQFSDLGPGSANLQVMGPLGEWTDYITDAGELDVISVRDEAWQAFRIQFIGTGGAGKVSVVGRLRNQ